MIFLIALCFLLVNTVTATPTRSSSNVIHTGFHSHIADPTTRSLVVENLCSDDGWLLLTNGAAGRCPGCPPGSTCDPVNNICFWNMPKSSTGSFFVRAGQTVELAWPIFTSNNVVWSGNLGICFNDSRLAQCAGTDAQCEQGHCSMAEGGPQSRAEFTLSTSGIDYYDISIIDGINVAMSVAPSFDSVLPDSAKGGRGDVGSNARGSGPYWCGSPGVTNGSGV